MASSLRIVLDTNVLVSAILFPGSVPGRAVRKAQSGVVLASEATCEELREVLLRSRFDRFVDRALRLELVEEYTRASVSVEIPSPVRACRDPRDDKFLEVAVHGRADLVVTGDADLLVLHPFEGIALLTPAAYLDLDEGAAETARAVGELL